MFFYTKHLPKHKRRALNLNMLTVEEFRINCGCVVDREAVLSLHFLKVGPKVKAKTRSREIYRRIKILYSTDGLSKFTFLIQICESSQEKLYERIHRVGGGGGSFGIHFCQSRIAQR